MDFRRRKRVGVIGGRNISRDIYEKAYFLGKKLSEKGYIVVCGGLSGVMEAVAKGVKDSGGISIGILPSSSIDDANEYIEIPIASGVGLMRNLQIIYNSHIIVAVDGSYGTLSEISYSLALGKKVLGYKTWDIEGVESFSSIEEIVRRIEEFFNA